MRNYHMFFVAKLTFEFQNPNPPPDWLPSSTTYTLGRTESELEDVITANEPDPPFRMTADRLGKWYSLYNSGHLYELAIEEILTTGPFEPWWVTISPRKTWSGGK
jgi:hypothetical protein